MKNFLIILFYFLFISTSSAVVGNPYSKDTGHLSGECDTIVLASGNIVFVNIIEIKEDKLFFRMCNSEKGAIRKVGMKKIVKIKRAKVYIPEEVITESLENTIAKITVDTMAKSVILPPKVDKNKLDIIYLKNKKLLLVEILKIEDGKIYYYPSSSRIKILKTIAIKGDVRSIVFRNRNQLSESIENAFIDKLITMSGDTISCHISESKSDFVEFYLEGTDAENMTRLDRKFVKEEITSAKLPIFYFDEFDHTNIADKDIEGKLNSKGDKKADDEKSKNVIKAGILGGLIAPLVTLISSAILSVFGVSGQYFVLSFFGGIIAGVVAAGRMVAKKYKFSARLAAFFASLLTYLAILFISIMVFLFSI